MNHAIVVVDFVGSTATKLKLGDAVGAKVIAETLDKIERALRVADPDAIRQSASEGDDFTLFGQNPLALVQAAATAQAEWREWHSGGPAVRISVGYGTLERMVDGEHEAFRGWAVDLTHAILPACRPGGVILTGVVREVMLSAGFGHKLVSRTVTLKNGTVETCHALDERRNNPNPVEVVAPVPHPFESRSWLARTLGNGASSLLSVVLISMSTTIIALCVGAVWWETHQHEIRDAEREGARVKDTAMFLEAHKATHRLLGNVVTAQDEANYLSTLSQQAREALKLQRPESLRQKLER